MTMTSTMIDISNVTLLGSVSLFEEHIIPVYIERNRAYISIAMLHKSKKLLDKKPQ